MIFTKTQQVICIPKWGNCLKLLILELLYVCNIRTIILSLGGGLSQKKHEFCNGTQQVILVPKMGKIFKLLETGRIQLEGYETRSVQLEQSMNGVFLIYSIF